MDSTNFKFIFENATSGETLTMIVNEVLLALNSQNGDKASSVKTGWNDYGFPRSMLWLNSRRSDGNGADFYWKRSLKLECIVCHASPLKVGVGCIGDVNLIILQGEALLPKGLAIHSKAMLSSLVFDYQNTLIESNQILDVALIGSGLEIGLGGGG
ncbi:hypothetical protein Acr_17g0000180 [Actinidia rufa]|uniref:Uncharacterized protein n=1 Tax=Actinidia rufa TaxID=165716 RepID=A0A7J0G0I5_9ERIC|nr:hypothetical protein Acr_17g0000180 [Actinidia rufa]